MQWISVKDRLPENNKSVLVYAEGTARQGNTYATASLQEGEFWFISCEIGKQSFPNAQFKVAFWMPLPEPPKE
ncbi:MAG TPA: hypothetical protein DDW34_12995 [Clostridium sp.]|nr:hypothetical protein [Clostridium sp.]